MFNFDFTEMIKEALAEKEAQKKEAKNNKVIYTLADEFKQKEMNITVCQKI